MVLKPRFFCCLSKSSQVKSLPSRLRDLPDIYQKSSFILYIDSADVKNNKKKKERDPLAPIGTRGRRKMVYLPRNMSRADIARARMNTVIATSIKFTALSKPVVMFPTEFHVKF